ncbi:MAG TPA: YggL family protein, partial [Noviherbaspirillum sp.]|nr:YggL family protein [Noviherbaspirillum sp.]
GCRQGQEPARGAGEVLIFRPEWRVAAFQDENGAARDGQAVRKANAAIPHDSLPALSPASHERTSMPAKTKGKYNQRQRKKLRLGEFQELGFEITANSAAALAPDARNAFINDLVEAVAERGLLFGGGFNDGLAGFVVVDAMRGSVSEEQRASLKTWLESRQELRDVVVGPLKDAWYST